jgi:hypothetical protein
MRIVGLVRQNINCAKNQVSLSTKGVETLSESFKNPEFEFESQINAKRRDRTRIIRQCVGVA